jgi:alpha-glucosidase
VTEFGSQVYWSWELDENHYKNMDAHIAELSQDGVKFLGYINTFLKKDSKMFLEAKEKNYLVKKQDDSIYFIKSTTFDAGIVDLTNPEAYSWYKEIIKKNMIRRNLAGWMADFGEHLPTDAKIYAHDAENLHNLWPTLWAKCNYDAIMEEHKENEIFFFSRAAFTSTIQYTPSMWCGDQHVDYSDEYGLGSVIPSLLSMSMSGVGVAHSDIGGYTTVLHMKRTPELFIRWMEMNIFSPILRCHEGNRPLVNAQFDHPEVIDTFIKLSNIFAKMKPYHDHVLNEYYQNDIPTIRPIFYQYDEPWAYEEKNAYLYGEDILVSPVLRKNVKTKEVHLPQGEWVQFFTNDKYSGGVIKVATPLGRPIAFYRQDSKFADLFKNITE